MTVAYSHDFVEDLQPDISLLSISGLKTVISGDYSCGGGQPGHNQDTRTSHRPTAYVLQCYR